MIDNKSIIIDEFVDKVDGVCERFKYFTKFFNDEFQDKELIDIINKHTKGMKKSKSIKDINKYLKVKKILKEDKNKLKVGKK